MNFGNELEKSDERKRDNNKNPAVKLVLTSDFPSTVNQAVFNCMRDSAPSPRIAWIPPLTGIGRERFPAARKMFESYGFPALEYCDIDEESNERQLERLTQYDIIYLTGGDPIIFRSNILQAELSTRLRQCLTVVDG